MGAEGKEVSEEPKPCPFCGQQDAFVEQLDSDASVVICQGMVDEHSACLARGFVGVQEGDREDQPGKEAAIREWNRRAQPAPAQPDEHVPDKVFQDEFLVWWEDHGQFCRSGGGDYERTFAFQAWRHLYPMLMQARAARPAQTAQQPVGHIAYGSREGVVLYNHLPQLPDGARLYAAPQPEQSKPTEPTRSMVNAACAAFRTDISPVYAIREALRAAMAAEGGA